MGERDQRQKSDTDGLLRRGLRAMSVPEASPDFDARVHRALAEPQIFGGYFWDWVRPFAASVVLSAAASIVVLAATQTPQSAPLRFPHRASAAFAAQSPEDLRYGMAGMGRPEMNDLDGAR